jgi:hypothetical protein
MDESLQLVAQSAPEEAHAVAEPFTFEVFFQAEARTLFRRLCAVTGNSAEAEEIMQQRPSSWTASVVSTASRSWGSTRASALYAA